MSNRNCLYTPSRVGFTTLPGHDDLSNISKLCAKPSLLIGKQLNDVFQGMTNGDLKKVVVADTKEEIYILRSDYIVPDPPGIGMMRVQIGMRFVTYIEWNSKTDMLRMNIIVPDPQRDNEAAFFVEGQILKIRLVRILDTRVGTVVPPLLQSYLTRNGVRGTSNAEQLLLAKRQLMSELYDLMNRDIPRLESQLNNSKKIVTSLVFESV